jgi:hypothetical protein
MNPIIPIYTSRGDVEIFLLYPYLFNMSGEWVGFVTAEREVYSVLGYYVGYLNNDPRLLRARVIEVDKPRLKPPSRPNKVNPPASFPLAPLMGELSLVTMDVLLEEPGLLHTADTGELRKDLE